MHNNLIKRMIILEFVGLIELKYYEIIE